MKELENKIREALPRLQKIEKGCIFTDKNKIIKYEVLGFSSDGKLTATYFNKFKISWNYNVDKFRTKFEIVGKPIMLNDVLEYINHFFTIDENASNIIKLFNTGEKVGVKKTVLDNWNLESPFLVDQNEDTINFLNNL